VAVYLLITTLLRFSRSWAELQRTKFALEETRRRQVETELRALRDQVNPHFLFNSLHSIYALALDRSERTADLVLRLSDILRFLVYESKTETIPLSREIECVEAFIALQRERLAESAHVVFVKELEGSDPEIAPLLLMPLVENAFKHGVQGKDTQINLELRWRDGKLDFNVSNRIGMKSWTEETGGLGLQNLKRRLTLQYPTRHKLEINPSSDVYLVHLSIVLE
jgi:LytS/YehU family sensor histidine kinase